MLGITTVTTKGQVTFPQTVRNSLGISVGDKIMFKTIKKDQKEITLRVLHQKNVVDELFGSLHKPGIKYIPIDTARKIAGKMLAKKYRLSS